MWLLCISLLICGVWKLVVPSFLYWTTGDILPARLKDLIISVFLYISTFTSLFFCLSYYICLLVYLYIHITFFCLFLILRNWKELICSYCYKCKASVVQTPWTPGWPINTEYSLPQNAKVSCWKYVSFVCICLVHFSTVCLTLTWQLEFVGCFITQFSVNRLFYLHNL
jgi:hypothetical protein